VIKTLHFHKWSLFLRMTISITEFKAKCLELLRGLEMNGEPITIMRHKTAVAVIYPASAVSPIAPPWQRLRGTVTEYLGTPEESVWDDSNESK